MPQEKNEETIPKHVYNELLQKLEATRTENEMYRSKSPLVGVRWFGDGGFGAHLAYPISGVNRISLNGYGDKAVIDFATWIRLKKTEHAEFGLLVRDDDVIDELGTMGTKAKQDDHPGPNSFTPKEAHDLLVKDSLPRFKAAVKALTSHWGAVHLLREGEALIENKEKVDQTRLALLRERRDYLQSEFRFNLMHPHDLRSCCEQYKVRNWEDMTREEQVTALTELEINMLLRE